MAGEEAAAAPWGNYAVSLQDGHEYKLDRPYWDASWPWPLDAIEDFLKGMWNFIIDLPWKIIDAVWDMVENLWNFLCGAFNSVANWIVNSVDSLWSGITTVVSQLWEGVKAGFDTVVSGLSGAIGYLADSMSSALQLVYDSLRTGIMVIGETIIGSLQAVWDAISGWLEQLWTGIANAFANFGAWITDLFSGVWDGLGAFLDNLGEKVGASFDAFGEWLNDGVVKPIANLPANLLGGVVDFVSDLFERFSTFLVEIFKPIANFFVKDVLAGVLKIFEPFAEMFEEVLGNFFDTLTGQVSRGGQMTPEGAYSVVPSMISVMGVMMLGFTGMTVAGELLHPLKNMGLAHVAAALYDVTNYKLISGAFVGALTYAMIRQPLGYYFNQWFHPAILDERAVRELMSRRAFTDPEALQNPALVSAVRGFSGVDQANLAQLLLGYHGYSSAYYGMFLELANTPLRYFPLAGIARTGFYDETWFNEALHRSGYSQTAVDQLHEMYRKMVLEESKGRHSSTVVKRYREGLTDESGFAKEMELMGYSPEQVENDRLYAQLEYSTDYAMDLLDGWRYAFRQRKVTEDDFRRGLASIGISEERIDGWVFREGVRRKETDTAGDLNAAKGAHASTVVKRYREGLIDDDTFGREMLGLGYSSEEVEENRLYAQLEYETDFAMDLLDGWRYAFRQGKVTEDVFRQGLKDLGMIEARIDGWVFREGVRRKAEE